MPTDPWSAIERDDLLAAMGELQAYWAHVLRMDVAWKRAPMGAPPVTDASLRLAYLRDRLAGPKPTIPEVLPAVIAYAKVVGGCEMVMHDGNVDDGHIDYYIQAADERDDEEGSMLYRVIRRMSTTQRRKMHARMWREAGNAA